MKKKTRQNSIHEATREIISKARKAWLQTEQEKFWAGKFGDEYIDRNIGKKLTASNLDFFSRSLRRTQSINNCFEFGANIGMNFEALSVLFRI